jgi:hypothetical protein
LAILTERQLIQHVVPVEEAITSLLIRNFLTV